MVLLSRAAVPAVLQRHLEPARGDELCEVATSGRGSDADRLGNVVGEEPRFRVGEQRENAFLGRRRRLRAVAAGETGADGRERVVDALLVDVPLGKQRAVALVTGESPREYDVDSVSDPPTAATDSVVRFSNGDAADMSTDSRTSILPMRRRSMRPRW